MCIGIWLVCTTYSTLLPNQNRQNQPISEHEKKTKQYFRSSERYVKAGICKALYSISAFLGECVTMIKITMNECVCWFVCVLCLLLKTWATLSILWWWSAVCVCVCLKQQHQQSILIIEHCLNTFVWNMFSISEHIVQFWRYAAFQCIYAWDRNTNVIKHLNWYDYCCVCVCVAM